MAHKVHTAKHHRTVSAEHGSKHGAHHDFHKGAAHKKSGHHGLIGDGKGKGMKAHPGIGHSKGGHFIATPSNVGKLGHKGA